jgi:periplasmic glucans biosynthesis protein
MDRRDFLSSSLSFAALVALARDALAAEGDPAAAAAPAAQAPAFTFAGLKEEARRLAAAPWVDPGNQVPQRFLDLPFEQYRDIRWKRDQQIWRTENRGFSVEPMAAGSVYNRAVGVYLVDGGVALPLPFDRERFDWGSTVRPPEDGLNLPFSGLRLRRPTDPDRFPEFAVFQGASYFKANVRDTGYGVTARGLALDTASPDGEEFPAFTRFYVEKPEENAQSILLYALLDSRSVTGAYRITLRPGESTQVDVEMTLFPRIELAHVGLGALNTMFLYDAIGRTRFDDIRPSVHLSDGLAIKTGAGERIWRPLANPKTLQLSAFADENPLGFGLVQRDRNFSSYEDLEQRWEMRPSAWIEPIGDWGKGSVVLVEIPSDSEIHENIVAYWRPKTKLPAGQEFAAAYRVTWRADSCEPQALGRVLESREGQGSEPGFRRYVVDFGGQMPGPAEVRPAVSTSAGRVLAPILKPNPVTGGYRVMFDLDPKNAQLAELRVQLTDGTKPVSETWLYRWVA